MEEAQAGRGGGQAAAAGGAARSDDPARRRNTASRSRSRSAFRASPRRAGSTASRSMPATRKACSRAAASMRWRASAIKSIVFTPGRTVEPARQRRAADGGAGCRGGRRAQARAQHLREAHPEGRTHSAGERHASMRRARRRSSSARACSPRLRAADSNIQLADRANCRSMPRSCSRFAPQSPASFARDETIEVATADESTVVALSVANGTLALENSRVAVATLNPQKAFGASSYGPLKYRVNAKGSAGDWQPLATLVRLPTLKALECPATPELACKLSGSESLSRSIRCPPMRTFDKPVTVPDGFLGRLAAGAASRRRHAVLEAARRPADGQSHASRCARAPGGPGRGGSLGGAASGA